MSSLKVELFPFLCRQKAKVAHLDESPRQHVAQKSADKIDRRQCADFISAGFGVSVAPGNVTVFKAEDVFVRQGHAHDVRREILEHRTPVAHRFDVTDPVGAPDRLWRPGEKIRLFQRVAEQAAKEQGQRFQRHKEIGFGVFPAAVRRQSTAGDEKMNVRMIAEIALPGVHHADVRAEPSFIAGENENGVGRGLKQDVIEQPLMPIEQWAQFFRRSDRDEKTGRGEQQVLLISEPSVGAIVLAFWAMAILTGVETIGERVTRFALVDLSGVRQRRMSRMTFLWRVGIRSPYFWTTLPLRSQRTRNKAGINIAVVFSSFLHSTTSQPAKTNKNRLHIPVSRFAPIAISL